MWPGADIASGSQRGGGLARNYRCQTTDRVRMAGAQLAACHEALAEGQTRRGHVPFLLSLSVSLCLSLSFWLCRVCFFFSLSLSVSHFLCLSLSLSLFLSLFHEVS